MTTSIPVMQGKMGSIEYFLTTMKAAEAVSRIKAAKELPEWDGMGIEERMQRKLDWDRIKGEIARFIASDPDRFYGAILVAIYNDKGMEYEPLANLNIPKAYANAAKPFGFLHLHGGETWFALDGQHRLKGTAVAMTGVDENGEPIENFERNMSVANDEIAVMLIPFTPAMRARKVFNKVNKYAKQTGKGDNIITSEDDAFAILARWLMGSDGHKAIIREKLVNWSSNTLTPRTPKFTTISVLYDGAETLLTRTHGKIDTQFRPSDADLKRYYGEVKEMWEALLGGVSIYKQAMAKQPQELSAMREKYLCMKPAGQSALIEAVAIARKHNVEYKTFVPKLNKIKWDMKDPLWQGIIMQNQKIQAGRQSVGLAARLIAHLIGVPYEDQDKLTLLADYQAAKGVDPLKPKKLKTLPNPV